MYIHAVHAQSAYVYVATKQCWKVVNICVYRFLIRFVNYIKYVLLLLSSLNPCVFFLRLLCVLHCMCMIGFLGFVAVCLIVVVVLFPVIDIVFVVVVNNQWSSWLDHSRTRLFIYDYRCTSPILLFKRSWIRLKFMVILTTVHELFILTSTYKTAVYFLTLLIKTDVFKFESNIDTHLILYTLLRLVLIRHNICATTYKTNKTCTAYHEMFVPMANATG